MFSDLAQEYANILDCADIIELFSRLERETGSRAEAARVCGLERRTTYDWRPTGEIRLRTKRCVLRALLRRDYQETLKYLLEKSLKISTEHLQMLLGSIYEKAMNPDINRDDFLSLVTLFREARVEYAGLINMSLSEEVSNMEHYLRAKSVDLGIEVRPTPLSVMTAEEVVSSIRPLARIVPPGGADVDLIDRLSQELNLPQEILTAVSDVKAFQPLGLRAISPVSDVRIGLYDNKGVTIEERYMQVPLDDDWGWLCGEGNSKIRHPSTNLW